MIKRKLTGLRAIEKDDLPILQGWRNITEFRRNFRGVRELNQSNQEAWYAKSCIDNPNDFMFVIQRIEDDVPIGARGLIYINWMIYLLIFHSIL